MRLIMNGEGGTNGFAVALLHEDLDEERSDVFCLNLYDLKCSHLDIF